VHTTLCIIDAGQDFSTGCNAIDGQPSRLQLADTLPYTTAKFGGN